MWVLPVGTDGAPAASRGMYCALGHLTRPWPSPLRGSADVVLGELPAPPLVVEAHHEAVVEDLLDRPARTAAVARRADRDDHVVVDGDRPVARLVGAGSVALRGVVGDRLCQPRLHDRSPPPDWLVVGVVAVGDVLGE